MARTAFRRGVALAAVAASAALCGSWWLGDARRGFMDRQASVRLGSSDPALRPVVSRRPAGELVVAVRGAARRLADWEYVGEANDGRVRRVLFVRHGRLLGRTEDIVVRIAEDNGRRIVTGESRSRDGWIEPGRNRRNLRRLLEELRAVLDAVDTAAHGTAAAAGETR